MICNHYSNLTPIEKVVYIGELIHAVQSNDRFYNLGKFIIGLAKEEGIFDGVTILPDTPTDS